MGKSTHAFRKKKIRRKLISWVCGCCAQKKQKKQKKKTKTQKRTGNEQHSGSGQLSLRTRDEAQVRRNKTKKRKSCKRKPTFPIKRRFVQLLRFSQFGIDSANVVGPTDSEVDSLVGFGVGCWGKSWWRGERSDSAL